MDHRKQFAVTMCLIMATAMPAGAQDVEGDEQDDADIEEVVVTATHRETRLMDTPMGIGAVTDSVIEEIGAQEMGEVFRMVSGLNMGGEGASQSRYTVRGVTSQQTNSVRDTAGAMVAVYLDGASMTSALGPARQITGNLFDIERVEVLKGPQGTLFGESAQGGAVRYIFKSPEVNEWDGAVRFGTYSMKWADDTSHDVNGLLNIPLIEDRLAARVVVFDTSRAGYIDQFADCTPQVGDNGYPTARAICTGLNEDVNSTSNTGGRFAIKYFDDKWSAELARYWVSQEGDGTAYTIAGNRGDAEFIEDDPYVTNALEFNGVNGDGWDDFQVTRLTVDATLGFADIEATATQTTRDSLTFRELAEPMVRAIDWATAFGNNNSGRCLLVVVDPDVNCPIPLDAMNMNSYGWGRLDRRAALDLRGQAGLEPARQAALDRRRLHQGVRGLVLERRAVFDEPRREIYDDIFFFNSPETSHQTNFQETSVFGEISYDLTDEWELTLGARMASLTQDFLIGVKGEQIYQDSVSLGNWKWPESFEQYRTYQGEQNGSTDNDVVSPRFVVTWRPSQLDLMAYFSYAEGYRPGGQNRGVLLDARRLDQSAQAAEQTGSLPASEIAEMRAEAEVLRTVVFFEGDNVVNYELGTKFTLWDGKAYVQTAVYRVDWQDVIQRSERPLPNGNIVGFNANEGAAEIWGFDLDVSTYLTDRLRASLVAAVVNTELTEALQNQGKELIFSSPFAATANVDYDWPLTDELAVTLHLDVSSFDERWFNTDNTIALPSYHIVNARATLRDVDDKWAVVLWAKNLGDQRIVRDRYSDLTTGAENPWLGDLRGSYQYLDPPQAVGLDFRWNLR